MMSRVPGDGAALHLATDASGGAIAHRNHGPLHDVVEPMA